MKLLILGGGPAGIAAAWYAKQKGITDITIVEKEDRIGGCAATSFYHGIPYEFGPQIMYTDEEDIKELFERFVKNIKPATDDGQYHPKVSVDGKIDNMHDFPVTIANVLKQKDPAKVIAELYRVNLDNPDFSNFENYMISRIGRTLYESYIKNYNIKHWKRDPSQMDADWAKLRTLTLRERNDMFQDRWQGHPGNHNILWQGLLKDVKTIKGKAEVSEDMKSVFVNGQKVQADLVISTLPLGKDLDYIHSLKVFVGIKEPGLLMPSYANSFPNNYNFTRIVEYKQQFPAKSSYSLLSFGFPFNDFVDEKGAIEEVKWFVKNVLKREIKDIWPEQRMYTYPVHNRNSMQKLEEKFKMASNTNIVPSGRCGVHAYVSKDVCFRMARIIFDNLDDVLSGGEKKIKVLHSLREKLR
jgi:UDP-galactopyranose mutase